MGAAKVNVSSTECSKADYLVSQPMTQDATRKRVNTLFGMGLTQLTPNPKSNIELTLISQF